MTAAGRDPATFADGAAIYDVPWTVELSNGQLIVGAYPAGWHAVTDKPKGEGVPIVNVRK